MRRSRRSWRSAYHHNYLQEDSVVANNDKFSLSLPGNPCFIMALGVLQTKSDRMRKKLSSQYCDECAIILESSRGMGRFSRVVGLGCGGVVGMDVGGRRHNRKGMGIGNFQIFKEPLSLRRHSRCGFEGATTGHRCCVKHPTTTPHPPHPRDGSDRRVGVSSRDSW